MTQQHAKARLSDDTDAVAGRANEVSRVHDVILFDGVCNLCNGFINFVIDHDPDAYYRFAPLQWAQAESLLDECAFESPDLDSIVLLEKGVCYSKSSAVLRILGHLKSPLRYLKYVRFLPAWMRDPFYDLVARNRYRWFGRRETCRMPTPEITARFLATD
jgi:predicted DCC family thiol-disulfide oxidoreductase YuxK